MRLTHLFESPIADISVHGDLSKPGSFHDIDKKKFQQPGYFEAVRKRFEKTPWIFNLYFWHETEEVPEGGYHGPYNKPDANYPEILWRPKRQGGKGERIHAKIGEIKPQEGVITVTFMGNFAGKGWIPMTPWIIAHRIGEALLFKNLVKIMSSIKVPCVDGGWTDLPKWNPNGDMVKILPSKAAQSGNIDNYRDFLCEILALYLTTGEAKPRAATFETSGDVIHHQIDAVEWFNSIIGMWQESLKKVVGKVLNV